MFKVLMDAFKKKQIKNQNPKNKAKDDDLPETVAEAEASAISEDEGLPSVNRKKRGGSLVKTLGLIVVLIVAAFLIVAVNSGGSKNPKSKKDKEQERQNQQIANRLPPITIPPSQQTNTAPPPVATAPAAAVPEDNTRTGADWSDRKLDGTILVGSNMGNSAPGGSYAVQPVQQGQSGQGFGSGQTTPLGTKLESTVTVTRSAAMLSDRNYLITKGTSLDCVLETAMDSTLPGITTCRLTRDIYSDNGRVLLLDRGTQMVGEFQGGVRQGEARFFVLWTRAKTPNGVIVSLDSPGADSLGRSGHAGWVDTHFMERFGAAILMSFVKDGITYLSQRGGGSDNTYIYSGSGTGGEKIVEKMLESTINMPPTITINQGEHIQIMVARDLDFSTVYGLQAIE